MKTKMTVVATQGAGATNTVILGSKRKMSISAESGYSFGGGNWLNLKITKKVKIICQNKMEGYIMKTTNKTDKTMVVLFLLAVFMLFSMIAYSQKVEICHIPPGNPSNAHAIWVSPNALDAHLAHGDYRGACNDEDSSGESNDLQFALSVSPNPYYGYTTIRHVVPEAGCVMLEVYNLYGIKIQTIVNEWREAGEYSFEFSAKSLGYPAGYYLLRLNLFGTTENINRSIILLEF
ncbi:MAG: hypothetical protein ABII90_10945 [Bacteroidota bacterium]